MCVCPMMLCAFCWCCLLSWLVPCWQQLHKHKRKWLDSASTGQETSLKWDVRGPMNWVRSRMQKASEWNMPLKAQAAKECNGSETPSWSTCAPWELIRVALSRRTKESVRLFTRRLDDLIDVNTIWGWSTCHFGGMHCRLSSAKTWWEHLASKKGVESAALYTSGSAL